MVICSVGFILLFIQIRFSKKVSKIWWYLLVDLTLLTIIKFPSSERCRQIFVAFLENLNFKEIIGRNKLGSNLLKKVVQKCQKLKLLNLAIFVLLFIPQFQKVLYKFSLIMFLFLAAKCTTSRKVRFCEHDSHSVIPTSTTDWWVSSTPFDFSQILAIRG